MLLTIIRLISLSFHRHNGQVKHYHIIHDGSKYYVSRSGRHHFNSVKKLIEYHKLNGAGMVTRLRKPPQQLVPQQSPTFGKWL